MVTTAAPSTPSFSTAGLQGSVVATDETGKATFDSFAVTSGPNAYYTLNFDGGDGVSR